MPIRQLRSPFIQRELLNDPGPLKPWPQQNASHPFPELVALRLDNVPLPDRLNHKTTVICICTKA
jgi:hypothetical protein